MIGCKLTCTHITLMHTPDIHAKKTRLKITQLEKVRFIKMNEKKLTQVETHN